MTKAKKSSEAPPEPQLPSIGDKVRLGTSDTVFTITKIYGDQVELNLDGTNIYRYRVPAPGPDLRRAHTAPRRTAQAADQLRGST